MGPRLTVSALGGYFSCQLEERVSCECHAQPENNKTKRGESSLLHSSPFSVTPLWEEKWQEWWWRRIVKWPDLTSYLSSRHGEWRVVSQDRDRGPLTTASTSNRQQERTTSHQLLTLDITTLSRTEMEITLTGKPSIWNYEEKSKCVWFSSLWTQMWRSKAGGVLSW